MPDGDRKRIVLFCTCRLWKGRTFSKLNNELKGKSYSTVVNVSAKCKDLAEKDFDAIDKIKEKLKE